MKVVTPSRIAPRVRVIASTFGSRVLGSRVLRAVVLGLLAASLTFGSATAEEGRLLATHQAAGHGCSSCHSENPPASRPAEAICFSCHGDQASLAAATAKADPNPHAPPHLVPGANQVCADCHSIHKVSEVSCTDCHRGFQFNVK